MMNPEVVNFPPPDNKITFGTYKYSRGGGNVDEEWQNIINSHHFNRKIIVQLPDTPKPPETIREALEVDTEYYCIQNLPLNELTDETFITSFVLTGKFYGVSCNKRLDVDDCAAMTPCGVLHVLVSQFTYQELSIEGTLSKHILRTPKNKYMLNINTRRPGFKANKKYYEKVQETLKNPSLVCDFWISWLPFDESVCPSSVAKYFHDKGYTVEQKETQLQFDIRPNISIPQYNGSENLHSDESLDFLEWLGSQALNINIPESSEISEVTSNSSPSSFNICHCSGLFAPSHIHNLINILRDWLILRSSPSIPWINLTVYGHPDSVVAWGDTEHSYFENGDNYYSIIIFKEHLWLYKVMDSQKPQRFYEKSSNK